MALKEEFEKQGFWLFRYRGVLPVIILVVGGLLFIQKELHLETSFTENLSFEKHFELFCLVISLFGLLIRILVIGFVPKNTSGRTVKKQVADTVNTTGMYSIVRHPLYVGNYFMWLGPAVLTGSFWFVIVFTLLYYLYYERIMFSEEQFLRNKFGDIYVNWSNRTPAFIPSFKNYIKPNLTFSWKKVVRKEINGLFLLILIFFGFDYLAFLINSKNTPSEFLLLSLIVLTIALIVIKILKKNTNLLKQENR